MKKSVALIISLLLIMLCGCAEKDNGDISSSSSSEVQSSAVSEEGRTDITSETESRDYPDLPETFADILNGGEFISEDGKVTNIKECDELKRRNLKLEKYALIDLDKDGDDEFVVAICDYAGYFIFHTEKDGKIYSHLFGYRWFESPKADGRFYGSSGAATGVVLRIASFEKTKYTETELCVWEDLEQIYKINSKSVSRAEARAYLDDFEKAEDLKWTVLK
ncbi:MAG: hypothetical protein KBS52_02810 [Clostridiales bacterium]|nr:hypothetical protein [Candidatus Equinaster intestinalis]